MNRIMSLMTAIAVMAVWSGCASTPSLPRGFVANLAGVEEVPPLKTTAYGRATFHRDGDQLRYKLMVYNIQDVTMANLHIGHVGENGDHIAWLYPPQPPEKLIKGRFSGCLIQGTLTAADLIGPMKGQTIADLVHKMKSRDIYVNVHTQQFPEGEIRGQVHQ
ncbi:MAG TPA: CHRD domain-containing protein [Verrucomicrobiae bacterium]|nr:CHRD domain-containing protein [Verrucomicrobiae bacterium]